jgi:DNA repair exonuclease SbcCD nuclease subunit
VNSFYYSYDWSGNVHILAEDRPYVRFPEIGTSIYSNSALSQIKKADMNDINILALHCTIDMDIGKNTFNPVRSEDIGRLGMDYTAVGHFHNVIKDAGGKRIYNPGSPEPLGFDEPGEHGIFIGSVIKNNALESHLEINFVKTNKRSYRRLEIYLEGLSNDEQVISSIFETLARGSSDASDFFDITLTGYTAEDYKINLRTAEMRLSQRFSHVRLKDRTRPGYDLKELSLEAGLRGLFTRKLTEQISNASSDEERQKLIKALYYGLEALDRGRISSLEQQEQIV